MKTNFKTTENNSVGTSLQGYVKTSYSHLVELFGEPNGLGDCYKVSTEWELENDRGNPLTIYDWKETYLYDNDGMSVSDFRSLPEYNWHIGGNTQTTANELKEFIEKSMIHA